MAEKGKHKLTGRQLRKLFAMGLLFAYGGKGKDRKIAYDKAKAAQMRKPSGGEWKAAKGSGTPGPRTIPDRLSALKEVAAGTRAASSLPERLGRYQERAQAAEAAAIKSLQQRAKQRSGESYYGPERKQRIDAAQARLDRVRSLKRTIQEANVPSEASVAVKQAGAGLTQRAASVAAKAAQLSAVREAATAAKAKRDNPYSRLGRISSLLTQVKRQQRALYGPTELRSKNRKQERYAQLKRRERELIRLRDSMPDVYLSHS